MKKRFLASLLIFSSLWSEDLDKYQKEAKDFSKKNNAFAIDEMKEFSSDSIQQAGVTFNATEAREQLKNGNLPNNEVSEFLKSDSVQRNVRDNHHLNVEESFIKNAEAVLENTNQSSQNQSRDEFYFETCQEAAAPFPVTFTRTLEVEVSFEPEVIKKIKKCKGHTVDKNFSWRDHAERWMKKQKNKITEDTSVCDCKTSLIGGNAIVVWKHSNNSDSCDHFEMHTEITKGACFQEKGEKWVYDNEEFINFLNNPDCTLMEKLCFDASPKNINGKEITRPCWKEKISFLCQFPKTKKCDILKDKNCLEESRQCLKESSYGCALWEIKYRCLNKFFKYESGSPNQLFGLDPSKWETDYEPNQSFSSVYTKMQIFEDIKKQMENQQALDASQIELFKGKAFECKKSVADNLLYDCCFSFGGLAKELKLSHCSTEEMELGALREKELCHYVGKYSEEFLDLWKSRDVHVFCCFPSKLARVFQEEARSQLELNWGKPKKPDCRGIRLDEISKVDFTKLDVSALCDKKIEHLEEKLQKKLKEISDDLNQEELKEKQDLIYEPK